MLPDPLVSLPFLISGLTHANFYLYPICLSLSFICITHLLSPHSHFFLCYSDPLTFPLIIVPSISYLPPYFHSSMFPSLSILIFLSFTIFQSPSLFSPPFSSYLPHHPSRPVPSLSPFPPYFIFLSSCVDKNQYPPTHHGNLPSLQLPSPPIPFLPLPSHCSSVFYSLSPILCLFSIPYNSFT